MAESRLAIIDNALAQYYKNLGRKDYITDEHGKFVSYCEENGIESDSLDEELQEDPADCMFLEFEDIDKFPFHKSITFKNTREKQERMLEIVIYCYQNKAPPPLPKKIVFDIPISSEFFSLTETEVYEIEQIYMEQCASFFEPASQEESLKRVLAIGKRQNLPYLQYLADMYGRDRIAEFKKNNTQLECAKWAITNKYTKEVKKLKKQAIKTKNKKNKKYKKQQQQKPNSTLTNPHELVQSAVVGFYNRVCPNLQLAPMKVIDDSLKDICKYVQAINTFISNQIKTRQLEPPFQIDFGIALKGVQTNSVMPEINFSTSDPSYSEDDPDPMGAMGGGGGYDDDDAKDNDNDSYFDVIGDVKRKLSSEKCMHTLQRAFIKPDDGDTSFTINNDQQKNSTKNNKVTTVRSMRDAYQEFYQQLCAKHGHNNVKEYQRKKRFCALIDRRDRTYKEADDIYFFEPPTNCKDMPNGKYVPEWYFASLRDCFIPRKGYDNGKGPANNLIGLDKTPNEKAKMQTINSMTSCNGGLMILSYHVEAEDEIRCYLYLNAQVTRFQPDDLVSVLPSFFADNKANKAFAESKYIKSMVEDMVIPDSKFESFYQKYSAYN